MHDSCKKENHTEDLKWTLVSWFTFLGFLGKKILNKSFLESETLKTPKTCFLKPSLSTLMFICRNLEKFSTSDLRSQSQKLASEQLSLSSQVQHMPNTSPYDKKITS